MPGEIIPAPLAAAPTMTSPPASARRKAPPLGARSVVQMAWPKPGPPPCESAAAAASMPGPTRSRSMRSPIVPVLQIATSSGSTPSRAAARRAIASASSTPGEPVAALAEPALTTTARRRARSRPRLRITGAEGRGLRVSARAEATGPSAARIPRSSAPDALRPQATAPARKPGVVVTDPPGTGSRPSGARTQSSRPTGGKRPIRASREQALGLGSARHEVEVLERLARGALAQVVDDGEDRDPAAARVEHRADLGVVGALHRAHARRGIDDLHEGVVGIVGRVVVAEVVGVRRALGETRVAGGQQPAVDRDQVGREGHWLAELLLDLGRVAVRVDLVRAHVVGGARVVDRLGGPAPGAADAGLGVDDHVLH